MSNRPFAGDATRWHPQDVPRAWHPQDVPRAWHPQGVPLHVTLKAIQNVVAPLAGNTFQRRDHLAVSS